MDNFQRVLNILQDKPILTEANLSSIIRKINKDDNVIAIITPFRKELPSRENEDNFTKIKGEVSSHKWGFLQLNGGWMENKVNMVHEKSIFIEVNSEYEDSLFSFCKETAKKYNQDGFIFKSKTKPFGVYLKNGSVDFTFKGKQEHQSGTNKVFKNKQETTTSLNKINFRDIEEMYSALRFGTKANIKFIFESIEIRDATSMIDSYKRKDWLLS